MIKMIKKDKIEELIKECQIASGNKPDLNVFKIEDFYVGKEQGGITWADFNYICNIGEIIKYYFEYKTESRERYIKNLDIDKCIRRLKANRPYNKKTLSEINNLKLLNDESNTDGSNIIDVMVKGIKYRGHITISRNPTHNCQLFCIGNIKYLILNKYTEEEIAAIFKLAMIWTGKKMFICDVNKHILNKLKSALNKFKITFKSHKYISTNNNVMYLCRIVLNPIIIDEEERSILYELL